MIRLDREAPRGAELEVDRDALPPPAARRVLRLPARRPRGRAADGARLGQVTNVEPGVANDVLELDSGLLLPLVEACVRQVDLDARRIVVEPGFDEAD